VWPGLFFEAEGRQGHAERGPRDRLQSAFGIQVCPRVQLVVGAAIIAIQNAELCQGGRSAA